MEGCQHNTMDVEYYGPNPQMGVLVPGRAARGRGDGALPGRADFAATCRDLFERGSAWLDAHLFNGEYYEHEIRPPTGRGAARPAASGMGAHELTEPELQLGAGCLVDQLVGQFLAHVCGLGYLLQPAQVRATSATASCATISGKASTGISITCAASCSATSRRC